MEKILASVARRSSDVDAAGSKATTHAQLVVSTGTAKSPDPESAPAHQGRCVASRNHRPGRATGEGDREETRTARARPDSGRPSLPAAGPVNRAVPEEDAPPGINELRLCRTVSGFGSFEPLNETSVKAGQTLLIYCELTGLQYEARDAGFVSRISSQIEIRPAGGGPIQWAHELGADEDVCRRRRHDFYVNYRVDLPPIPGTRLLPPAVDTNRPGREPIDLGRDSADDQA